jgi:hypothetical protein
MLLEVQEALVVIAEAGGTPAMFSHTADALVSVDADAAGYLD